MVKNHTLGLIINVILHILILFIFLSVLFFTIISKKEKDEVNHQLNEAIGTGINKFTDQLNNYLLELEKKKTINEQNRQDIWKLIKQGSAIEKGKYLNETKNTIQTNNTLFYNTIIIILLLCFIVSFFIVYVIYINKRKIGLKYIVLDNIFIFMILGIIEFGFFWYIIQNYIPIYPEEAEIAVLDRLNSYFEKNQKHI